MLFYSPSLVSERYLVVSPRPCQRHAPSGNRTLDSDNALRSAIFSGKMPRNAKIKGGEQGMHIKVGVCAQFTNYSLAVHAKCRSYMIIESYG